MRSEHPTRVLRDQHVKILKVADVLESVLAAEEGSGELDFDAAEECVRFIRLYADALHHGKEEDLLFPELEARGLPRHTGPIAVMLHEHEQARSYTRTMADALPLARTGDVGAVQRLRHAGLGYVALMRGHIGKEDDVLFNMADQVIDGPSCRSLCSAYDGVCRRTFDGCTVAELEGILERLLERCPDV